MDTEIDRHHRIRTRRDLALDHVTMQIDETRHEKAPATIDGSICDLVITNLGDDAILDPHRAVADDFTGKDEREITEPHGFLLIGARPDKPQRIGRICDKWMKRQSAPLFSG